MEIKFNLGENFHPIWTKRRPTPLVRFVAPDSPLPSINAIPCLNKFNTHAQI